MSRYRFLLLALILVLALVWLAARSLPPGLDAPTLFNLIEYQAIRHLNLGHADSTHTGAVFGTVWDTTGNPVADAVVIVSTARGQATWGWTDAAARYHLDMVPAGWYVGISWCFPEPMRSVRCMRRNAARSIGQLLAS